MPDFKIPKPFVPDQNQYRSYLYPRTNWNLSPPRLEAYWPHEAADIGPSYEVMTPNRRFEIHVRSTYSRFIESNDGTWDYIVDHETRIWTELRLQRQISEEAFKASQLVIFQMRRLLALAADYHEAYPQNEMPTMSQLEDHFTPYMQAYGSDVRWHSPGLMYTKQSFGGYGYGVGDVLRGHFHG